jgi:HEPN domain-containing protein
VNIEQAANLSRAFALAAQRCDEQRPLKTGQVQWLAVPAIVCTAFSIELAFKAIILRAGGSARGHDLHALFSALPEPTRQTLTERLDLDAVAFDRSLRAVGSSFGDWRYYYERGDSLQTDCEFLRRLSDIVQAELARP